VLVLDRPATLTAGRLYRIAGGRPEIVAYTNRGLRMAIDPLTADVFVTQEGNASDGGGEVLRVDTFAAPPTAGHYRGNAFYLFDVGNVDGGIAFDAAGNFYVSTGRDGRVVAVDRGTGAFTTVAGNYMDPVAVAVAPGRVGTAGAMGASLFVLDDVALYEVGVDGVPAPAPPAVQPMLAPATELRVHGFVQPGIKAPITLDSPAHPGQLFAILPTFLGKVPGFPLKVFGDPDPRVIPNNYNFLWFKLNGGVFSGCFGVLDGAGKSPVNTGFKLPNDPTLLGLDLFFDLAWIVYDPADPNGVDEVGGTAQLYIGE
jgi:hypothetical protein